MQLLSAATLLLFALSTAPITTVTAMDLGGAPPSSNDSPPFSDTDQLIMDLDQIIEVDDQIREARMKRDSQVVEREAQMMEKRRRNRGSTHTRSRSPSPSPSNVAPMHRTKAKRLRPSSRNNSPRLSSPELGSGTDFSSDDPRKEYVYDDHIFFPGSGSRPSPLVAHPLPNYLTPHGDYFMKWFYERASGKSALPGQDIRGFPAWMNIYKTYMTAPDADVIIPALPAGVPKRYGMRASLKADMHLLAEAFKIKCRPFPAPTDDREKRLMDMHEGGCQHHFSILKKEPTKANGPDKLLLISLIHFLTSLGLYENSDELNSCMPHLFNIILDIYYQQKALTKCAPIPAQHQPRH